MKRAVGLVCPYLNRNFFTNILNRRQITITSSCKQIRFTSSESGRRRMGQPESKKDLNENMASEYTTSAADQRAAQQTRDAGASGQKTTLENIQDIPKVEIDEGRQKYVLVKVQDEDGKDHWFVRGNCGAAYHNDAATPLVRLLEGKGVHYEVVGGGRIMHDAENKNIKVYGHSIGFPWAGGVYQHDRTCEVLREKFSDYKASDIYFENEGY